MMRVRRAVRFLISLFFVTAIVVILQSAAGRLFGIEIRRNSVAAWAVQAVGVAVAAVIVLTFNYFRVRSLERKRKEGGSDE